MQILFKTLSKKHNVEKIIFENLINWLIDLQAKLKAREEVLKAQKLLEEKQRAEEDMLLKVAFCVMIRNFFC